MSWSTCHGSEDRTGGCRDGSDCSPRLAGATDAPVRAMATTRVGSRRAEPSRDGVGLAFISSPSRARWRPFGAARPRADAEEPTRMMIAQVQRLSRFLEKGATRTIRAASHPGGRARRRAARTRPSARSRDRGTGRETCSRRGSSSRPAGAWPGSTAAPPAGSSSHSKVLRSGRHEGGLVVAPVDLDLLAAERAGGPVVPVGEDVPHQAAVGRSLRSGRCTPGRSAAAPASGCTIPGAGPARR